MLIKIAGPSNYRPRIGDHVRLASGSPRWLIVDFEGEKVICSYDVDGIVHEIELPAVCLVKEAA